MQAVATAARHLASLVLLLFSLSCATVPARRMREGRMPWMRMFVAEHGYIAGPPAASVRDTPEFRVIAGAAESREKADGIEIAQESREAVIGCRVPAHPVSW